MSDSTDAGVKVLPVGTITGTFIIGDYIYIEADSSPLVEVRKLTAVTASSLTLDYATKIGHESGKTVVKLNAATITISWGLELYSFETSTVPNAWSIDPNGTVLCLWAEDAY